MKSKGTFITFEGGEGAGKSTVLAFVAEELTADGYEVVETREPGGVRLAEKIRYYLLDDDSIVVDARAEALLFAAARRQHLMEKIVPALEEGKVVLCDRFVDSSLAYQGAGRGIGVEAVQRINDFAIEDHLPDCTLLFDLPVNIGQERIQKNKRGTNHLDDAGNEFHEMVRRTYHKLASQNRERYRMIKAGAPVEEVRREALIAIRSVLDHQD